MIHIYLESEHPLMLCRSVKMSTIEEMSEGRGGLNRLTIHEERICSTYSLLVCFAIFHAICDFITLVKEKLNFVKKF